MKKRRPPRTIPSPSATAREAEDNATLALRLAEGHLDTIRRHLKWRHEANATTHRIERHAFLLSAIDRMRYARNCLAHAETVLRDLEGKR